MEKIIKCEHAYSKEYCNVYTECDLIRFTDYSLPEMYDHNYTYIKNKNSLRELIESEIDMAMSTGQVFLKIVFEADNDDLNLSNLNLNLSNLNRKYSLNKIGYYSFDVSKASSIKRENYADILKVNQDKMLDDMLFCDLALDGNSSHKEFHEKKTKRRGDVYLAANQLDAYICYKGNNVVGICDLFMYEKVAKIENFVVIPRYQRQGYGTFILNKMINTALESGAELIYLITDEEDTAKEMYEKLYFNKIATKIELFFNLID